MKQVLIFTGVVALALVAIVGQSMTGVSAPSSDLISAQTIAPMEMMIDARNLPVENTNYPI